MHFKYILQKIQKTHWTVWAFWSIQEVKQFGFAELVAQADKLVKETFCNDELENVKVEEKSGTATWSLATKHATACSLERQLADMDRKHSQFVADNHNKKK